MNTRRALLPILSLLALLALDQFETQIYKLPGGSLIRRAMAKVRSRELHAADLEIQAEGYYEGLLNEGARANSTGGLFTRILGSHENDADDRLAPAHRGDLRGFLAWGFKPNDKFDSADGDSVITNSFAMADKEYTLEKPPQTWRIAVLGDSVTRGRGVPFGRNFESLLEDRLNKSHLDQNIRSYELLNFAVDGYRITQILDLALDKVPPFHPDVYLVCMSELTSYKNWGIHLGFLVTQKRNLKYDYLKQLARQADLKASDDVGTVLAKLTPYRVPLMRWAFTEMKANADRQGAAMVLLMVPSVIDTKLARAQFAEILQLAREARIPVIDLLDVFKDVSELGAYRVSSEDRHPNELANQLIFEDLYQKILADPEVSQILLGKKPAPAAVVAR